ncbi:MAG: cytochrome c, partial [Pseudomonadota bacterium]
CNACHASRNLLGATSETRELSGGLIPVQNWYAPSLSDPHEAGVADWPLEQVVALLQTGTSPRASVMGPMAEVVFSSTQHLNHDDLSAMATFLRALPAPPATVAPLVVESASPARMKQGSELYDQHCAQCHGAAGQGSPGLYPALAGNRAVTMASAANLVRVVLSGGFLPSTQGNPRPFGMPPFTQTLNEAEIAAVLTFIRGSWGNQAAPISAVDVLHHR